MSVTSSGASASEDSQDEPGFDFTMLKKVPLVIDLRNVKPLRLVEVRTTLNPNVVDS